MIVQIMRETLIYLSHLDHDDTEKQVCESERTGLILFCQEMKSHCNSFFVCILNCYMEIYIVSFTSVIKYIVLQACFLIFI